MCKYVVPFCVRNKDYNNKAKSHYLYITSHDYIDLFELIHSN